MQKEDENKDGSLKESGGAFSRRLCSLGTEAFRAAKTKLAHLPGQKIVLSKPVTLYIDTCNDSGYLYKLNAGSAALMNDTLHVFGEGFDFGRLDRPSAWDELEPDEYWCEGGTWYAEWEGLFDLIDAIMDYVPSTENES